jgi:hypothetical protein
MEEPRLKNLAEKVTLLQTSASGDVTPVTLYKEKRKKKRSKTSDCNGPCRPLGRKMGACSVLNRCCSPF